MEQLRRYQDDELEENYYMNNMGRYFLDAKEKLQCPLCAKWMQSSKKNRHGPQCYYTSKLAG